MMSIAYVVIVFVVAVVCLALGMSVSRADSRRLTEHEPVAQPRASYRHSNHRGGGGGAAILLLIAVIAAFSWTTLSSETDVQQATVVVGGPGARELGSNPSNLPMRPATGEKVASDRVTQPLQETDTALKTEPEVVAPALSASNSGSGESSDATDQIATAAPYESADDTDTVAPAIAETSSSSPRVDLKADIALWAVFPMLCLAILIAAGVWIAHRRQHWSLSGMARSTVQSLWVVPILASIGWVGYLIWPHLSVEPLVRNTDYNPSQIEFAPYVKLENEPIDEVDESLLTGQNNSLTQEVSTAGELPDWVTQGVQNKGGFLHVPVRSKWRVTPSAADNYARAQAMRVIRQDFSLAYPEAEAWRIDAVLEDLNAKVAECTESKVFAFREEPMYQTHLLVELSDEVRGELVNRCWIPELQELRMGMLLTFGGLLTLVCFAGAACLNFDLRTEGQYRRWLRTATVLAVVAAAAAAHGVLNSLWFPHSV